MYKGLKEWRSERDLRAPRDGFESRKVSILPQDMPSSIEGNGEGDFVVSVFQSIRRVSAGLASLVADPQVGL